MYHWSVFRKHVQMDPCGWYKPQTTGAVEPDISSEPLNSGSHPQHNAHTSIGAYKSQHELETAGSCRPTNTDRPLSFCGAQWGQRAMGFVRASPTRNHQERPDINLKNGSTGAAGLSAYATEAGASLLPTHEMYECRNLGREHCRFC